ncbi:Slp family lipoprotein [Thiohalomonas denitrificans]|nr:Slp family lipoprotein [Thiohalomonas denitrificans]
MMKKLVLLIPVLLLFACATGPELDTAGAQTSLTPGEAVQEFNAFRGEKVVWGGQIVGGTNLDEATRLEILAYPLDSSNRPDTGRQPIGRFLVRQTGYLELSDYAPGRAITVVGVLTDTREGRVGQALYRYPVVHPSQMHLWQPEARGRSGPSVHFGIGVILGN